MRKKICVYFRDLPSVLETFASQNKMVLQKDGVYPLGQVRAARLTVDLTPESPTLDHERRKRLVELLAELERNNQILAFSA